jgi:hypothetical protein
LFDDQREGLRGIVLAVVGGIDGRIRKRIDGGTHGGIDGGEIDG